MGKKQISDKAYKVAYRDIQARLAHVPDAFSVIGLRHSAEFVKETKMVERLIRRLKALLRMLTALAKLNPTRYKEYWHEMYSQFKPSLKQVAITVDKRSSPKTAVPAMEQVAIKKTVDADNVKPQAPHHR